MLLLDSSSAIRQMIWVGDKRPSLHFSYRPKTPKQAVGVGEGGDDTSIGKKRTDERKRRKYRADW
jgi:hypothetical protein